jgi:hypothetical protein
MKFSPFMILVLFTFFAVWLKVTGFLSLSWLMIFMPLIIFSVLIFMCFAFIGICAALIIHKKK